MYAVIAVTINRSPAPTGKNEGQWAGSESWVFLTRQIRHLYPIEIEKRQHTIGTHAALPLQGISWPVFKKG